MSYSSVALLVVVLCCAVIPLITGDNEPWPPLESHQVIAPHCKDRCGNVIIPYPFGIGKGCYFKEHDQTHSIFEVRCHKNTGSPVPHIGKNLEVLNVSVTEGEFRSNFTVSYRCYNNTGFDKGMWTNLSMATLFTLSSTKNALVAIGCDTYAWFSGLRSGINYSTGCMTTCAQVADTNDGECSGFGCCQTSIPSGFHDIKVNAYSFKNHSSVYDFNPCSVAFPVAKDAFRFYRKNLSVGLADFQRQKEAPMVPVVYDWVIGQKSCSAAKADGSCLCKKNAECLNPDHGFGYRCKCKQGFSGNPYLPYGCTDINECKEANDCEKAEYCINTIGSYYCQCPKGHHGNGTANHPCISDMKPRLILFLATASGIMGAILLVLLGWWLNSLVKRRQLKNQRAILFARNGGMLLQQHVSSDEGSVERVKIFNIDELEKATDYFNEDRILGKGGHGTVYKGMLSEGKIVAVKKSNKVEESLKFYRRI